MINDVLVASKGHRDDKSETVLMMVWLEHVTGRHDHAYAYQPSEFSYEGWMLAEINVCFDHDKYHNVVYNESRSKLVRRQLELDENDSDSDDDDLW